MVNMLVKCEAKSNRVKGLAFHPTMPWILSALHSGSIHLWDYQLGTLLDKFEEHEGPVRGMSFHANQPLFVSGADDYKVKVWNYKLKRCLFTLLGHLDYIRTTVFHHEYPWILSASDDQTIRIWNWQSRQCIAVLTGHNHYVMSAAFHPKDDLVISASLDQTIRVWDVSGLKEKTVSSSSANRPPSSSMGNADLFGVNDAVVKFVLEGHERGVNWAEFHHSQPLIVSGSDDRTVKLWRYNETKAWEIDTLRGHFNNVSAVTFHPKQDLIISDGEDKTIRVWDATKRQLLHTFKRESDRFWVLSCHTGSNLIAAGHDSGMVVFKLDRERPLCAAGGPAVYVVQNRQLVAQSSSPGGTGGFMISSIIGNCRKQVSPMASGFKSLLLNPFNSTEMNLIVTYDYEEGGSYDLFVAPNQAVLRASDAPFVTAKPGQGQALAFIARNRFAVLSKDRTALNIMSMHNELSKKVELPPALNCETVFCGGTANRVLLRTDEKVVLFDTSSREILAELALTGSLRQAIWSANGQFVALLMKHTLLLADANLKFIQSVTETIRIKSGVWDESVFVYSTSSHVKYALPYPEEHGVIQTVPQPVYLVRAGSGSMTYVDRECNVVRSKLFSHEYLFKQALLQGRSDEVLQHLKAGRLLGSVTIGYLKKKGFPEVALHFVKDKETRFNLSLEFGHLAEAFEAAKELKKIPVWDRLHTAAIRLGNVEIAEKAAIAKHDVDALQFLYLLTGNEAKLGKLASKVAKDQDHMARFNLALLRGDVDERVKVLSELGLDCLAELTRRGTSLKKIACVGKGDENWPLTVSMEEIFAAQWAGLEAAAKAASAHPPPPSKDVDGDGNHEDSNNQPVKETTSVVVIDAKAWGDSDLDAELESVQLPVTVAVGGTSAEEISDTLAYGESMERQWLGRRRMVVDLVAAGEFGEALSMLQKKIGLVNAAPLEPLFMDVLLASHASLPGMPFAPSLKVPIMKEAGSPAVLYSLGLLKSKLAEALHQTGVGNSAEALAAARDVLHGLTLSIASSKEEEAEMEQVMATAQKYALAMLMETTRRTISQESGGSQKARELELACLLCCAKLDVTHLLLVVGSAMNVAFRAKNFVLAAHLARRIITGNWGSGDDLVNSTTLRARKVLAASEEKATDEVKINFDPAWLSTSAESLKLCSGNLAPIHPSLHEQVLSCPFCKSAFHPDWEGRVCTVCQLSAVGATTLGIQFMPL